MDELVKIMECRKMTGHTAYPVFYDVEPTEVRNQIGAVGQAFEKHENEEAAGKWREALKEAASLAGERLQGDESEFIKKLVGLISLELRPISFGSDQKLFGMETRVKDVVSSLEAGIDEVRMIGIKGMGGAGKTTTARAVFDHLSNDFEAKSFVGNVREVSNASMFGLKNLQEQVLSNVLNEHVTLYSVDDGKNMMKKRMCGIKVLLVLDDVDHIDQLEALAGQPNWFKPGSKIIITTRYEQVLVAHRANSCDIKVHDINLLSYKEAICLFSRYAFSRYAFGRENPLQEYEELSGKVVRYAAGLPLTVKVLGSFLCGKDMVEWVDAIERLKTIPLKETMEILELSYIGLEGDYQKIFLDIACILKGQYKEDAIRILECSEFYARNGLKVLEQRSLITVDKNGCLGMHDHIEEMGKNIVRRSHPDEPYKHSRVWIKDEIEDILANDMGTEETSCLKLNKSKVNAIILMKGFGKMKKLRYLEVNFASYGRYQKTSDAECLDDTRQYFPNSLKYIKCLDYPFSYLPETFQANNLVGLEMKWSRMVQLWNDGEKKVLKKLKFLSLNCSRLTTFDFRMTPNLETLSLNYSQNLVKLCMPVTCQKLKHLFMSKSKLKTFDLELTPNLESLSLENCADFEELIVSVACPSLKFLDLSNSRLRSLDLELIPNLERLDLAGCDELVKINAPAGCLKKVVHLNLSGCLRYTDFIFRCRWEPKDNCSSATLDLTGKSLDLCPLHPNSNLPKLQFRCYYDENLSSSVGNIEKLMSFGLCACTDFKKFSDIICSLQCLKELTLQGIPEIPKDIGQLESLEELRLYSQKIKHLPDTICMLNHLKYLKLTSCALEKLPEDLGRLECLKELDISGTSISHLPQSIFGLKGLHITASSELLQLYDFPSEIKTRTLPYLVWLENQLEDVVSSLEIGIDDDVWMIGIKGMGGAGKTTTARAVFDRLSADFEAKSFVANVREVSNGSVSGLKNLQEQVLSRVLNEQVTLDSVYDGKNMMQERMQGIKVLLVLDDVNHIDQLVALAGQTNWFKKGSRIIVTTRDEQVLQAHRVNFRDIDKVDHRVKIRDIDLLSDEEAIFLLSRHAFGRASPPQEFEKLSGKVVHYAAGLPLTVKVLGSFLRGKDTLEWVDAIDRLKTIPLWDTLKKLELSYINLEDEYKEIFLDIACILKGHTKEDAIRVLECCGFHATNGLKVLEQRSLITVDKDGFLGMHDQIEEMGKNIVHREHRDEPNKRSRLWFKEEIEDILVNDKGTEATICLELRNSNKNAGTVMKGLGKMKQLRYLHVGLNNTTLRNYTEVLDNTAQYFSNSLKYIKCTFYPFLYLPKTFQANNLVGLEMKWSRMVQLWEEGEKKVLPKLKFLSLSKSKLRTFDLGLTPNLEKLSLNRCADFEELHVSSACPNLKFLQLSKSRLRSLDLELFPNLEKLDLKGCVDFEELHVSSACPNLKFLEVGFCSRLRSLDLELFPNLERLDHERCGKFKYDVFLSFRGEDTRNNFLGHLYEALTTKGIVTYKDYVKIRKGKSISDNLIKAIKNSRFYIIVFSKNYASSSWCLDELVKIMECEKKDEHTAYPVFYDVEPTEVRNQIGAVGQAFEKHENEEAAGKWREALKEAADLAGRELKNTNDGHEAKVIKTIVQKILLELCSTSFGSDQKLVGMETRVKDVVDSLEMGIDDDVWMIGIKGMGGAGKTTTARAVFDRLSADFEAKSFVANVREVSEPSVSGLKKLQKQVLSDVMNEDVTVNDVTHGKNVMQNRMCAIKILLVLDDVDHIEQLEALAGGPNWFKPGSRIIVTTRSEQVLEAHRLNFRDIDLLSNKVDHRVKIRDIDLLSDEEAIFLLSRHAFGRASPSQGFEKLSEKVVSYAAGLPLTVKVLGSSLCGKAKHEWEDAIERLKEFPLPEEILKML